MRNSKQCNWSMFDLRLYGAIKGPLCLSKYLLSTILFIYKFKSILCKRRYLSIWTHQNIYFAIQTIPFMRKRFSLDLDSILMPIFCCLSFQHPESLWGLHVANPSFDHSLSSIHLKLLVKYMQYTWFLQCPKEDIFTTAYWHSLECMLALHWVPTPAVGVGTLL